VWVLVAGIALSANAQISLKRKTSKGPRALGLLELTPDGEAHLIPIAIMVDGRFYDAQAYKASPVPMALWSEVVYEAEKTGAAQGLFTVTGALQNQATGEWMAEGRWQTASALAAAAHSKTTFAERPRGMDQDEGPPVLRHSGANKPAPPESGGTQPTAPTTAGTTQSPAPAPAQPTSTPSAPSATSSAPESAAAVPQASPEPEDPNRPVLKRGKQPPKPEVPESAATASSATGKPAPASPKGDVAKGDAASNVSTKAKAGEVQLIPAISDAGGPEPQSYVFVLKAGEEEDFRKRMLAMAADEIRARDKEKSTEPIGAALPPTKRGKTAPVKPSQPNFKDVELRVFDLTNSNEATLVLTATAQVPASEAATPERLVTLVAREDLNGEFHKIFFTFTDAQHLDVTPRWELIDAVDANGDGSGELLFRKVYDTGSAYAVYRVVGDQLYPLFEGATGG